MFRSPRLPTHNTQKGQALVLAIALFAVAGVVLFMMFNSGRAVNEKINLVNAADAAAYSGAQIAARNLNFMAYTNRAMIANEVAIGHLFTYELEMDMLGQVFDEGFNDGGQLGGFVSALYSQLFPFFTQNAGDLALDFIMTASEWVAGGMIVLYDNNNRRYSGFQDQAFRELVTKRSDGSVIDETMRVIAETYLAHPGAEVRINDPESLASLLNQDPEVEISQDVLDAIAAAENMNQDICEMILFASPSGPGGGAIEDSGRTRFCSELSPGSRYRNPESTVDNGSLIAAIEATYQDPENYTGGLWINDRNIADYALNANGQTYGTATRSGQTTFEFRNNRMNWFADNDSLTMDIAGNPFTFSGSASDTVQTFANTMNWVTVMLLNIAGLCDNDNDDDDNTVNCSVLRQSQYQSVQRYAVLNSQSQSAIVTAFLEQDNCSDGIGRDAAGNVSPGWQDNLTTLDQKENFCKEQVYALARAEIFYERPDCYELVASDCTGEKVGFRQFEGNTRESPNLFNPFWQVRLVQ